MKTQKIGTKLVLKKKTVANLNDGQMDMLKGGVSGDICVTDQTCRTDCYSCLFKTCTSNFPRICDTLGEFCDP